MFDIPNAKRVRRSDIDEDKLGDSSNGFFGLHSPDADNSAVLQARLAHIYGDIVEEASAKTSDPGSLVHETEVQNPSEEDNTYAFRLFSTSSAGKPSSADHPTPTSSVQKITLSSLSPPPGAASPTGRMLSTRPISYYHTAASASWTLRQRTEFSDPCIAVPGSWVLSQSRTRIAGCELPWRVKTLTVSQKQFAALNDTAVAKVKVALDDGAQRTRKARPNKKRRIALRERERRKFARKLEAEKMKVAKEQEDREKKTRRNREKKVKKKARDKAKKAGLKQEAVGAVG